MQVGSGGTEIEKKLSGLMNYSLLGNIHFHRHFLELMPFLK